MKWTERVTNDGVLERAEEKRTILRKGEFNWACAEK